jgi:arginyl-tRNA synthetase
MSLTVDTKNIPVGLLAILAANNLDIKVEAGSETLFKSGDASFNTVANTVRYIIRANNLFNETNSENQQLAHVLDLALSGNVQALNARISTKTTPFLTGSEVTVADFIAWCVLREQQPSEYIKAVEATPAAQQALKQAQELKATSAPAKASASSDAIPEIPGTGSDPSTNPIDAFKNFITVQIAEIGQIDPVLVYQSLDNPRALENGDLAIALPRLRVKGNPAAIAKEWASAFVPNNYIIEASAAGPFLNFRFNKTILMERTLKMISSMGEHYGDNTSGKDKTVVVEFSSPNIAKPFHAGHLRSTIIGAFVRNVYHANGWNTVTMNYLGDWGKQYGKCLVCVVCFIGDIILILLG